MSNNSKVFDKYGNYKFPTDIEQRGLNVATSTPNSSLNCSPSKEDLLSDEWNYLEDEWNYFEDDFFDRTLG